MQAVYLTKYGNSNKVFDIRETEKPQISEDEVLIKVASFGLNFADIVARRGFYPEAPKNPAILGYDVAGTIEAVGANVTDLKIGQRVAALTRFGGYAEYAKSNRAGVGLLPDALDYNTGTALATQACTAYYCAEEMVSLHEGDHVLVHAAAGGVGTALVQLAKHHGCIVIGTASTKKQDYLKSIGVDLAIDYTKEDCFKRIEASYGKHKIDVIFDSIGGSTFKKGVKQMAAGGRMVSFGAAAQIKGNKTNIFGALKVLAGFGLYFPIPLLMKSKSIITVNMLQIADNKPAIFQKVFEGVMKYSNEGILKPKIAKVFEAKDIAKAHDYLEGRQSIGKVVVRW